MQCFCLKGGAYDFYIKTIDPQTIVYNDISEWMDDDIHVIPNYYVVDVRFPNSSLVSIKVAPLTSTVIKASDLGISRFKDGIYCFIIDPLSEESGGCGYDSSKCAAILPNIECCLQKAYSILEDKYYDDIKEVEKFITNSKMSSELGQEKQAAEEYNIARRLLDKLNCECNC